MKLHAWYNFHFSSAPPSQLHRGFELDLPHGTICLAAIDAAKKVAEVRVTVEIDAEGLTLAAPHNTLGGPAEEGGIDVPEKSVASEVAVSAARLLTFIFDNHVHLSSSLGKDNLVPESPRDEEILKALGNRDVDVRLGMTMDVKPSIAFRPLDSKVVKILFERESGLALYLDAVGMQSSIAQYRELWKILEAAFGAKNGSLVTRLSQYPPAKQIGIDLAELNEMLVIRGRASHAYSRAGLDEYKQVARLAGIKVRRLKNLAEQVLITKKVWGDRSLACDPIADLTAFVNQANLTTIRMHGDRTKN